MSRLITELNGDNLTDQELLHRNQMVERLLAFLETNGCRGCDRNIKHAALQRVHSMQYASLKSTYQDTFGWPLPLPVFPLESS